MLQATVESVAAPRGGAPSEPKRGRRMKLAGSDVAAADVGDVSTASSQEAESGLHRGPTGAPATGVPLVSPPRRSGAEARGVGEPLRLADRPLAGQALRIVRATRESHGDAEKEIPGVLRNAEENYRPGEVPAGTDKSRAAQDDSLESL